ncbi:hypothetical protein ALC57_12177 [Trachymyrmex cornetzi]|uniref:SAP domain-containing protein n=1 Tax=Trachymyrmex cornetzi TaxID=471704 RepID=A0A151J1Q8_9HYME|nr:hypothetical protein ALC57_12177 [Trachymyrmex cornetzi]
MPGDETFSVVVLREKLREQGLPTTGTKAELLARLYAHDPEGTWRFTTDAGEASNATAGATTTDEEGASRATTNDKDDAKNASMPTESEQILRRELELLRRERDLHERELQLIRLENERLRQTPEMHVSLRNKDVKYVAGLAKEFDGSRNSFWKWEQQIRY